MLFVILTDQGVLTQPLDATSFADAGAQVKALYGQGAGTVRIAALLPELTGTLHQADDPANATITMSGDSQTQKTIRDNLTTFLGLASPTNAQVVAAVRALARLSQLAVEAV